MAEQNKTKKPEVNVEELLKKQAEEFEKKQQELAEQMQAQLNDMVEQNKKLTEELDNLKTNTAEENALLGEQIAKVAGEAELPKYNPFAKDVLYMVENTDAGIKTLMTGDEVSGIVGSIDRYLEEKLIKGAKKIEKNQYIITLYEDKKGK